MGCASPSSAHPPVNKCLAYSAQVYFAILNLRSTLSDPARRGGGNFLTEG
jgi:hypothetical protein